jgi:hypothetical protein
MVVYVRHIPFPSFSLATILSSKLRSLSSGVKRTMYNKFVGVKLWGIIVIARKYGKATLYKPGQATGVPGC